MVSKVKSFIVKEGSGKVIHYLHYSLFWQEASYKMLSTQHDKRNPLLATNGVIWL
jgi:hypothetical protein